MQFWLAISRFGLVIVISVASMVEGLSSRFLLLLILTSICVSKRVSSQLECYNTSRCVGTPIATGGTIEDCCLGDGLFFGTVGEEGCTVCVVFGWMDGPQFSGVERTNYYSLNVGFIKGGAGSSPIRFNVDISEGTAVQGDDFSVSNALDVRPRPSTPGIVTVILRVDGIALEPDETFQLRLVPENEASMATGSNEFLIDTLDVTIIDQDDMSIQLTELEHSGREKNGEVSVTVERHVPIATPVTVMIVAIDFGNFSKSGRPLPADLPADLDLKRYKRASSFPIERRDFNITPIEVTFEPSPLRSASALVKILINDDNINEPDEHFMIYLDLVDAIHPERVDLNTRNVSIGKIVDNDPITIGFEFPEYRFREDRNQSSDVIHLVKENNLISEQSFEVVVTAVSGYLPHYPDATYGLDYSTGESVTTVFHFNPEVQNLSIPLLLFDDNITEGTEAFQLQLSNTGKGAFFSIGRFSAIVLIEDNENATVGFEKAFYEVREDVGTIELCLRIFEPVDTQENIALTFFLELETTAGSADENDYLPITFDNNPIFNNQFGQSLHRVCFTVTVIDDNLLELTESFSVRAFLEVPVSGVLVVPDVVHITILDDDFVQVGFDLDQYTVMESVGVVTLNISVLDGALGTDISVELSIRNGTAMAPSDYNAVSNVPLLFNDDSLTVLVNVTINNDEILETFEKNIQVSLVLTAPILDDVMIRPDTANIWIQDDDSVTIGFDSAFYSVAEGTDALVLTVSLLEGHLGRRVTFHLDTVNSTAVAPSDYSAVTDRQLFFDQMTTIQSVVIAIVDDDEVEGNETFTAELSLVSADVQRVTVDPDTVTITITDNDIPPPNISVSVAPQIDHQTYMRNGNTYTVEIGREFQLVCTSSGNYTAWSKGGVLVPQVDITEADGSGMSGFRPTYIFPPTEVVGQLYAYQENDSVATLGTRKSMDGGIAIGIQEEASGVYECVAFDGEGTNTEQVVITIAEPNEQGNSAYLRFSTGPTVEELQLMFGVPSEAFVAALFSNMVLNELGDSLDGQRVVDCYIVASRVQDESNGWTRFECNVTQYPPNVMLIEHVDGAANSLSEQLDGVFIAEEFTTSSSGFCAGRHDDTPHGTYSWPEIELNMNATVECAHGPIDDAPEGKATRQCNSHGLWDPYYGEECVTTTTYNIQRFRYVEITAENAEEIIRELAVATAATVDEKDQSTQNLEVIAYVFESIALLLEDGELQVNENFIESATEILDSISDWPQEVVQMQSSLIVESYEAIAANLVENKNFTQLELTREDIILLAKRIPAYQLDEEEFTAPPIDSSGLLYENVTQTALLELPSIPIDGTVGVFFTFYTTPILFPLAPPEETASNETNDVIDSAVIGASIAGRSIEGLEHPVVITQSISRIQLGMPWSNVRCVSWEFNVTGDGRGNWTTRGCEATHIDTHTGIIRCECNHLTNFAVLVGVNDESEAHGFITNVILQVAAIAGSILSMLSLILAMVVLRKRQARNAKKLHIQHSIALFCMLFFFLIGIDQTDSDAVCTAMSLVIQYFTLVVAFLMAIEAVLMFHDLARTSMRRINLASFISWILPIIFQSAGLATLGTGENHLISEGNSQTDPQYCFLDQTGVRFAVFLAPLFATLLFITAVFGATVRMLLKNRRKTFAPLCSTATRTLFCLGTTTFLFGLTWVFGAITFMDGPDVFLYLFVIFIALQGLVYCISHKDSQDVWIGLLKYQCLKKTTSKHVTAVLEEVPSLETGSTHTICLTSIQTDEKSRVDKLISEEQAICVPGSEVTSVMDCDTLLSTPEPSLQCLQSSQEMECVQKLSAQLLIPRKHIQLKNLIGDGEFGIVYKAHLCIPERVGAGSDTVAVKTLKGFFDEMVISAMMKESLKMMEFNHPNVLNLIGVCIDGGPAPFIVMPFMTNGSLLSYLRKERPNLVLTDTADQSLVEKLMTMCLQIARGMGYLASKKFVHRDLAARNCMLDDNFIIRIADFGLSENVYSKKYFRMENHRAVKLPIKWMAPESLGDGLFTEKSDVWSFGVVCWEIFSGGKTPYAGIHPLSLIGMVEDGHRLGKPKNTACSNEMYQIMRMCWHADPTCRPPFSYFVESISKLYTSQNYPDTSCKTVNPVILVTQPSASEQSASALLSDQKGPEKCHIHRTTTGRQPENHHTMNGEDHKVSKSNLDHPRTYQDSEIMSSSIPTPSHSQKTNGDRVPLSEQPSPYTPNDHCDSAESYEMAPGGGRAHEMAPGGGRVYEMAPGGGGAYDTVEPYETIVAPYDSVPTATCRSVSVPKDTPLHRAEHGGSVHDLITHYETIITTPHNAMHSQKPSAISLESTNINSNQTEDNRSSSYDTVDHYESIVAPYDSLPEPSSISLPEDTPCELREKDRFEHGGSVHDLITHYETIITTMHDPMHPQKTSQQSTDINSTVETDNRTSPYDTIDPYESIVAPYDRIPEP